MRLTLIATAIISVLLLSGFASAHHSHSYDHRDYDRYKTHHYDYDRHHNYDRYYDYQPRHTYRQYNYQPRVVHVYRHYQPVIIHDRYRHHNAYYPYRYYR